MPHNESVQKLTRIINNFDDEDDDRDQNLEEENESEQENSINIINRNMIIENGKAFKVVNPLSNQNGDSKSSLKPPRNHNDLPSDDDEDFCDTSDNIYDQVNVHINLFEILKCVNN